MSKLKMIYGLQFRCERRKLDNKNWNVKVVGKTVLRQNYGLRGNLKGTKMNGIWW